MTKRENPRRRENVELRSPTEEKRYQELNMYR